MKFHKVKSLPDPFLRAFAKDEYSKGASRFSATQLLSPPQQTYLATQGEGIQNNALNFASLMGTAVHKVLEDNVREDEGEIAEKRFFATIDDVVVSGQVDFISAEGVVTDYKNTAGVQEEPKQDHVDQAQMNGYLASLNGVEVNMCSVVYIQRDWKEGQAKLNPAYPQSPFTVFAFDYDEEAAKRRFTDTIREHVAAEEGNPRECTKEERWSQPEVWALMKKGGKRSSKNCLSLKEAESLVKKDQFIQHRPGATVRCNSWCPHSYHCPTHQKAIGSFEP